MNMHLQQGNKTLQSPPPSTRLITIIGDAMPPPLAVKCSLYEKLRKAICNAEPSEVPEGVGSVSRAARVHGGMPIEGPEAAHF
jgi:hypothetical protein